LTSSAIDFKNIPACKQCFVLNYVFDTAMFPCICKHRQKFDLGFQFKIVKQDVRIQVREATYRDLRQLTIPTDNSRLGCSVDKEL
jgi:hypothetical protein